MSENTESNGRTVQEKICEAKSLPVDERARVLAGILSTAVTNLGGGDVHQTAKALSNAITWTLNEAYPAPGVVLLRDPHLYQATVILQAMMRRYEDAIQRSLSLEEITKILKVEPDEEESLHDIAERIALEDPALADEFFDAEE